MSRASIFEIRRLAPSLGAPPKGMHAAPGGPQRRSSPRALFGVAFAATMLCAWPAFSQTHPPAVGAPSAGQLTMWEADPWRVVGWFALVVVLTALVTALAVQRRSRRRAQSEQAGAEHHMRMAAAAAGVGLWTHDLARGTYWANHEHRAILAIGDDEVPDLGERLDLVHEEDRARVAAAIGDAMKRGGEYAVRHRIVLKTAMCDGLRRTAA